MKSAVKKLVRQHGMTLTLVCLINDTISLGRDEGYLKGLEQDLADTLFRYQKRYDPCSYCGGSGIVSEGYKNKSCSCKK